MRSAIAAMLATGLAGAPAALAEDITPPAAAIIAKLRAAATVRGLPPDIAEAVGFVETGFDPSRIGAAGEVGVMQVMPKTAEMLGFAGTTAELADVDINIRYGTRYLASAWELAGHNLCGALNKYRAGHGSESMSPASVNYCRRALSYLASKHSALAEGVAPPATGTASVAEDSDDPPAAERRGRRGGFWAREQARVRRLSEKVRERWALIAAHNARVSQGRNKAALTAQLTAKLRALR